MPPRRHCVRITPSLLLPTRVEIMPAGVTATMICCALRNLRYRGRVPVTRRGWSRRRRAASGYRIKVSATASTGYGQTAVAQEADPRHSSPTAAHT